MRSTRSFAVYLTIASLAFAGVAPRGIAQSPTLGGSKYLFVWAGDVDRKVSDFLAVIDADPASKTYGHVVGSAPAGAVGTMPHHTEYEFPADRMLLASGWAASRTFLFDLRRPTAPHVVTSFGTVGGFSFPHAFARLPNGHLLGTFQGRHGAYAAPGGLVELDERGRFIRGTGASAGLAKDALADSLAWPYSLAIDVKHDRVLTTNTAMPIPSWLAPPAGSWRKARADSVVTSQIEIWRLSTLEPLHVITLPKVPGAQPVGGATPDQFSAEPRLMPDGSIYVNTFSCGLYRVTGLDSPTPEAKLVHVFPATADESCAVPAIVGHYWIQTVPALPGLVALDVRDPAKPVEVARLVLPKPYMMPHWLSSDPKASRVVLTGGHAAGYVLVVNVDPNTGALSLDPRFRDERTGAVGVTFGGRTWPHGTTERAFVHGTLFGPR